MTPARLLLGSFALLILAGTVGLRTLPGLYTGSPLSWMDALFTATSAVCVTGLIVVDTATYFTPWGQAFLLLLIQLGGLGILTFATVLILAMGRRLSLRHRVVAAQGAELVPDIDFRQVLRGVLLFTLLFEAAGGVVLFLAWIGPLGVRTAAWAAVFHSISAYCNAGFSTFSDSLEGFRTSPWTLSVVMFLIVVGGVGFLTLTELHRVLRRHPDEPRRRMSLQTRLVLATTAGLIVAGWGGFAALEWRASLGDLGWGHRAVNALFMSVTARTAGFNTVDYADVTPGSGMITMLLMSIGGSPGSTAGGMKTTTFAVLLLAVWARMRGLHEVAVGGRAVSEDAIQRALVLWVAGSVVMAGALLTLSVLSTPTSTGGERFLATLFEAVSAFNTVGLSMGVTSGLDAAGKSVVVLLMYLGRVGPMATAAALVPIVNGRRDVIRHAREDLIVG
jgi:trk system potassium uptake protein TrkH